MSKEQKRRIIAVTVFIEIVGILICLFFLHELIDVLIQSNISFNNYGYVVICLFFLIIYIFCATYVSMILYAVCFRSLKIENFKDFENKLFLINVNDSCKKNKLYVVWFKKEFNGKNLYLLEESAREI